MLELDMHMYRGVNEWWEGCAVLCCAVRVLRLGCEVGVDEVGGEMDGLRCALGLS